MEKSTQILLNEVQRNFPLVPKPYEELARRCGFSEEEVLRRLARLKEQGLLRQISAIFNPQALGYRTSLVAASVPKEVLSRAAEAINAYPGVSHNYLRDHRYNLWFTIAVPPGERLQEAVERLLAKTGASAFLLLPIKRVFRIALILDLMEEIDGDQQEANVIIEASPPPDKKTISLVRATQEDLPLVSRPFAAIGKRISLSEEEVLSWLKRGLKSGLIRRFAGLIRHTKAGFKGNVMVAWRVSTERLEEVGRGLASERGITHCYERLSYPHWPYNLYTMLHARSQEEALKLVRELAPKYGLTEYIPLVTIKELKKIRLKLFWNKEQDYFRTISKKF